MNLARLFTHGSNAYLMFKFPARPESVFELRFPEHWKSPATSARHGDRVRVHGGANTVQWTQPDAHRAQARWEPGEHEAPWDRPWRYTLDYEGHEDFLDISLALTYDGPDPWDGTGILACLRHRMADPFIDPEGHRTWLYRHDGPVTAHDLIAGQFPPHRMMGAALGNSAGPQTLKHPVMATFNRDGTHASFIVFEGAQGCSANFGSIHCIHSNPGIAGMQPGETRVLRGRVYCIPARGPEDVLARWEKDRPDL